ncbi:hypothetical protein [Paenibacillus sp. FSL H8-0332]|uniref:hypothetical protein n=1 Tax=Paenibacillus sp. FSL H8-0332 TaxID=2954742 RepID=UPI0030CBE542
MENQMLSLQVCNAETIGLPPQSNPSPPIIPIPPTPETLCTNTWVYIWTNTNVGNLWVYVQRVIQGKRNTLTGCALFQDWSGRFYYQQITVDLAYITMYVCHSPISDSLSLSPDGVPAGTLPSGKSLVKLCLYQQFPLGNFVYELTPLNTECPTRPWDERILKGSITIPYDPAMPETGEFK